MDWPLSIVVSRRALQQYQLAFRHLAELKWAERDLTAVWQVYQGTRALYRRVSADKRTLAVSRTTEIPRQCSLNLQPHSFVIANDTPILALVYG